MGIAVPKRRRVAARVLRRRLERGRTRRCEPGKGIEWSDARSATALAGSLAYDATMAKRSEKPKKSQKQQPQKTLKERRTEKRAAKKHASGG